MSKELQILYMQIRLVRLAGKEWALDFDEVNRIFTENGVYKYIEDLWELFHIEGDRAVLEDIGEYLTNKGVAYDHKA